MRTKSDHICISVSECSIKEKLIFDREEIRWLKSCFLFLFCVKQVDAKMLRLYRKLELQRTIIIIMIIIIIIIMQ